MTLHVSSTCAHHQEVKIVLHSLWYHHTYRCDDMILVSIVCSQQKIISIAIHAADSNSHTAGREKEFNNI